LATVVPASALKVVWDDPINSNVKGTTVYWNEIGDTDTPYNKTVFGATTIEAVIDDNLFKPGQEYTFWATAYNDSGESGESVRISYTAPIFTPKADNLPLVIYNIPALPLRPSIL
jgi:hypothetical protein